MTKAPPERTSVDEPQWYSISRSSTVFIPKRYIDYCVIEVPCGWRTDGTALMSFGDAAILTKQNRYVSTVIGKWLKANSGLPQTSYVLHDHNCIIIATKPICSRPPYESWKNEDNPDLIELGLKSVRLVFEEAIRVAKKTRKPGYAESMKLVLRPPGTYGGYAGLSIRKSMRIVKATLHGIQNLVIVSEKL